MQEGDTEARVPVGTYGENRRFLMEAMGTVDQQISALHAAGRELLARRGDTDSPMGEIRFDIRVRPEQMQTLADSPGPASECYTESYICGKGPTGYIRCTVEVCIEVEPVTVTPG
jgi:hypothetical protein